MISSVGATETSQILGETDIVGTKEIFSLPISRLLVITRGEGQEPLLFRREVSPAALVELSLGDICVDNSNAMSMFDDPSSTFCTNLFGAKEIQVKDKLYICLFASLDSEYAVVFLEHKSDGKLSFCSSKIIDNHECEATSFCSHMFNDTIAASFLWENGTATVVVANVSRNPFLIEEKIVSASADDKIVALDVYPLCCDLFCDDTNIDMKVNIDVKEKCEDEYDSDLDDDDYALYGSTQTRSFRKYKDISSKQELQLSPKEFDMDYRSESLKLCLIVCRLVFLDAEYLSVRSYTALTSINYHYIGHPVLCRFIK